MGKTKIISWNNDVNSEIVSVLGKSMPGQKPKKNQNETGEPIGTRDCGANEIILLHSTSMLLISIDSE